jgi:centromeric protein E
MLHEGLNGCLFTFGQIGSGKTFSILGGSGGGKKRQLDGVIPRIADELFISISRAQADRGGSVKFQVRVTYLEVCEDNVFDLMSQPSRDEKRHTREIRDASVPAAQVETVTSIGVLMDLIARGSSQRATQATSIHDNSSRSHVIVTLTLECRRTKGKGEVRKS